MTVDRYASRRNVYISVSFFCLLMASAGFADTLRVVTQNSLDFRGSADAGRLPYFRTVMRAIQPDVVLMEEMASEQAMDLMLAQVFALLDSDWTTANFMYDGSMNQVCFYRMSKAALVSQRAIRAEPRNINEFVLRPATGDTTLRLHIMVAHLKASQGYEEERRQEADSVRRQTNMFPAGTNFLMCGDFNLYTATEPAFQTLTTVGANANGQFFDPINQVGNWHDNSAYAPVHTQSTRTSDYGDGGATGGMDDRFDFILVSGALMDTAGSHVLPATYRAYGQDGHHMNQAVNEGNNTAVPDSVAFALGHESDHLPVMVEIVMRAEPSAITVLPHAPNDYAVFTCYPNPFNSVLTVDLSGVSGSRAVAVYDILGHKVLEENFRAGAQSGASPQFDFSKFGTGTYFVQLRTPAGTRVQRVSYVR